jgi:medium-chain acyl-[acyl-carrier-protein] hydrolase
MEDISNRTEADRSKYFIRPIKVKSPKARLVAFPYAGGSAVAYYKWAEHLSLDTELISLQYPGRGRLIDMSPCISIHDLAKESCKTIWTLSDKPLIFFGHSLGAIVAFETIRMLRRFGNSIPKALVVSSRQAPESKSYFDNKLHTLPDDQFLSGFSQYGGIPSEIMECSDMVEYLMPLLRADITALETWSYKPESPLEIPIMALGSDQDITLDLKQLQRWSEFTHSTFQFQIMHGNHFYFQGQLTEVVNTINKVIEEAIG